VLLDPAEAVKLDVRGRSDAAVHDARLAASSS
jgi:hypothetical protein